MRVLRANKESLMAVLEAFVYDPLINWRLLNTQPQSPNQIDRMRGIENMAHEEGPEDGHRNFSVSRRLNRIEVEAVANENAQGPELLNSRAVAVVNRVSNKLTGRDFNPRVTLDVPTQVDRLILQATSLENLCQCYVGWCAFW
ncbi:Putative FKBP12-rapamycin complex-associated protein [Rhizopus microsporus]|nr:Putative FKBP12-rapamycin complex-associated protein [Rhizopus microsporus]